MLEDVCQDCSFRQYPCMPCGQGSTIPYQQNIQQPYQGTSITQGQGTTTAEQQMVPQPTQLQQPSPIPGVDFVAAPGSPVIQDSEYTQGYLRTQIGKYVRVEFLVGTNILTDRTGTLMDVGISYIILKLAESDDLLLCDIYAIKFVQIYL